jgi:hypothetical protein
MAKASKKEPKVETPKDGIPGKTQEVVEVKITDLEFDLGNPRMMSKFEMEKLKVSLKEFGYVDLAVVDENNKLIGGHQRVKAMLENGFTDNVKVMKLTGYTESEKKALNIALNKIAGVWDYEKLYSIFEDLKVDGYDLSMTGFDEYEFNYNTQQAASDIDLFDTIQKDNESNPALEGFIPGKNKTIVFYFETQESHDTVYEVFKTDGPGVKGDILASLIQDNSDLFSPENMEQYKE